MLLHTAIDARDCRGVAEFYRELLGLHYRDGEEPPTDGSPDDADWLVLLDDAGNRVVTVQEKKDTTPPTWPSEEVPMQMHLDFKVPTVEDLERHRGRAEALGRPGAARPLAGRGRAPLCPRGPGRASLLPAGPVAATAKLAIVNRRG